MSKIAEQKALEEYSDVTLEECNGDTKMMNYCNNDNSSLREGYIKGYDQAMQDFMEKACKYLESLTVREFAGAKPERVMDDYDIQQFKKYMQNESEN